MTREYTYELPSLTREDIVVDFEVEFSKEQVNEGVAIAIAQKYKIPLKSARNIIKDHIHIVDDLIEEIGEDNLKEVLFDKYQNDILSEQRHRYECHSNPNRYYGIYEGRIGWKI